MNEAKKYGPGILLFFMAASWVIWAAIRTSTASEAPLVNAKGDLYDIPEGVAVIYSGGVPSIAGHQHLDAILHFNCEGCAPLLEGAAFAYQAKVQQAQQQARAPQPVEKE